MSSGCWCWNCWSSTSNNGSNTFHFLNLLSVILQVYTTKNLSMRWSTNERYKGVSRWRQLSHSPVRIVVLLSRIVTVRNIEWIYAVKPDVANQQAVVTQSLCGYKMSSTAIVGRVASFQFGEILGLSADHLRTAHTSAVPGEQLLVHRVEGMTPLEAAQQRLTVLTQTWLHSIDTYNTHNTRVHRTEIFI